MRVSATAQTSAAVPSAAQAPAIGGWELTVPAADNLELAATLFELGAAAAGAAPLVVIGGATAVKRGYYTRFATYLAEMGHPVLTFDYRGIGGSRRGSLVGSKVRMRDWCILDVPGVLAWAHRTYPQRPIHWVGHSMGGFATGLAYNNHLVARQLNIARSAATGAAWPRLRNGACACSWAPSGRWWCGPRATSRATCWAARTCRVLPTSSGWAGA